MKIVMARFDSWAGRLSMLICLGFIASSAAPLGVGLALGATPVVPTREASASCSGTPGSPGDFELELKSTDYTRTYRLHVPKSYNSSIPTPLVINFHGWGGTGAQQEASTGMSTKADEEGFITIHPDGIDNSWNGGSCCGTAAAKDIDDVQFARDLVQATAASYCIDSKRIFATGFSNGGYMSHRLGCEASDVFAAIAPASGLLGIDNCAPPRPVPVIQTQGTRDALVWYDNASSSNQFWVDNNQCGPSSLVYKKGGASCVAYSNCLEGATVEWCEVKGMKHIWPTSETGPGWIDNTDMFWSFFASHPMP